MLPRSNLVSIEAQNVAPGTPTKNPIREFRSALGGEIYRVSVEKQTSRESSYWGSIAEVSPVDIPHCLVSKVNRLELDKKWPYQAATFNSEESHLCNGVVDAAAFCYSITAQKEGEALSFPGS